jgi:hypothetical protein
MRRVLLAGVLAASAALPAAAQDAGRSDPFAVPKKGESIVVKGCLRGGALDATEARGADSPASPLAGPLRFRLTGDKRLLKSLRSEHNGRIVEVRGVLRSDWPADPNPRQVGRVRIQIGAPDPSPNSPEASSRRAQPALDVTSFSGLGTACGR